MVPDPPDCAGAGGAGPEEDAEGDCAGAGGAGPEAEAPPELEEEKGANFMGPKLRPFSVAAAAADEDDE